jgi:hypothetical protein
MSLENWVLSLSKFKQTLLKITDRLLTRVNLEPIEEGNDIVGAKAVWVGDPGETEIRFNSESWQGKIETEGDAPPAIEYWQHGNRRGFALRHPKSLLFELDRETLNRLASPKNAGIATIVGAAAGFLGWAVIALANRANLVKPESETASQRQIES